MQESKTPTTMPRNAKPNALQLSLDNVTTKPSTSRPNSSPIALQGIDLSSIEGSFTFSLSSLPPLPSSPPPLSSPTDFRDPVKNQLDSTLLDDQYDEDRKNSTATTDRLPATIPQADRLWAGKEEEEALRPSSSSMSKIYHLRKAPGSTPELSLVGGADSVSKSTLDVTKTSELNGQRPPITQQLSDENSSTRRKEKAFRNPLTRTKSQRKDSHSSKTKPNGFLTVDTPPPRAAPVAVDNRTDIMFRDKGKEKRGKSTERTPRPPGADEYSAQNAVGNSMKNALAKAKTGSGNLFSRIGKIARSGSSHEREPAPISGDHVLRVISLPLVEQTRITRISKSLDACKDKTEYWMPSLPWRCIDYLNLNCESEGLYRIPGSGPQIKQWQRRFDTELDIDLLDEKDLYDPNTISSLLKLWLRELPTEVFPVALQNSLAVELEKDNADYNKMGQPAPQKLRDALSELPPFNYYLLFAITCHLSLLVSHQDKNRMDLNNLSICISPCLKIERWLFNYLIGDWRNCWQGCWTEKRTLEEERKLEDPTYFSESELPVLVQQQHLDDERAVSSSGGSMMSAQEHIGRPGTSGSRQLPSRDASNNRSASADRRLQT